MSNAIDSFRPLHLFLCGSKVPASWTSASKLLESQSCGFTDNSRQYCVCTVERAALPIPFDLDHFFAVAILFLGINQQPAVTIICYTATAYTPVHCSAAKTSSASRCTIQYQQYITVHCVLWSTSTVYLSTAVY